MIELLGSMRDLGTEEIYNDGRSYTSDYSTELVLKNLRDKINEIIQTINKNDK